jgi:two-component system chemotaxis sensor kinase CheA
MSSDASHNDKSNSSNIDDMFGIDSDVIEQVSKAFFEEARDIFEKFEEEVLKLESNPGDEDLINLLFRKVHTLKGSVGAVPGGQLIGSLSHEFEALLNRIKKEHHAVNGECVDLFLKSSRILKVLVNGLKEKRQIYPEELSETIELIARFGSVQFDGSAGPTKSNRQPQVHKHVATVNEEDQGVWLNMKQLNEILRVSGELLVLKNFFIAMSQTVDFRTQPELFERRHIEFAQNLAKISDQLQFQVQGVRKDRADLIFHGVPVLVRAAATELDKSVEYVAKGMDLLIDKSLAQDLVDMVVHLARNSIDHGIEDQFERAVQGKSSIGKVTLEVSEKNGVIHLIFSDDGVGLNKERILRKAISAGLTTEADIPRLTDDQIYRFIFNAGFSTKDKVTTMSGRGVGMDVVETTVKKYGGKIDITSVLGQGSTFHLELPIPQNIMFESTLICTWNSFHFAIPLMSVSRIISGSLLKITTVNHFRYCQYNGMTTPLLNYQEMLTGQLNPDEDLVNRSSVVFVNNKSTVIGLIVDNIDGQADLVVKNFGKILGHLRGFKGISILADENVTYIVDPEMLVRMIVAEGIEEAA